MTTLTTIPFLDVRAGGPVAHARARQEAMAELRLACLSFLPRRLHGVVAIADRMAKGWLERSASPYAGETDEIAALADGPGVYLINTSYEWGCTAAGHSTGIPNLVRTLDWPFSGMGKGLSVTRQAGPAGEYLNVTWPGAVGVLTAMAPGRFAATINQAPFRRRTGVGLLRPLDYVLNALNTYRNVRDAPPDHALRQVFETARDYAEAKAQLSSIPLARPVLYALVGTSEGESCVIERTETEARIHDGTFAVANDWQEPLPGWEPRSCGGPFATDSRDRRATLHGTCGTSAQPFDWLVPPVHNWETRLAAEMSAGDGTLRVIGYDSGGRGRPSVQVTEMLEIVGSRPALRVVSG
jgi:hypothetical protein